MPKSIRAKSAARKPLSDVSNAGKPSRPHKNSVPADCGGGGDALDRLLLARSDLADLIAQIDELVALAIDQKTTSKKGSQVIQSFSHVLADMHSSLKPWIPRFHQTFGSTTTASQAHSERPKDTDLTSRATGGVDAALTKEDGPGLGLIVSPSPLVSWRAGACKVESGRQLFMLTPLPKSKVLASSKKLASFKQVAEISSDKDPPHDPAALPPLLSIPKKVHDDLLDRRDVKPAPSVATRPCTVLSKSKPASWLVSPMNFTVRCNKENSVYLITPCSKTTLPKSCALINGVTDSNKEENQSIPKPTQTEIDLKVSSEDSFEEVSQNLQSRYQELIGFLPTDKFTSHKREVDGTLDWFLSPPKTCVLMEPSDGKVLPLPQPLLTPGKGALLATPMWKDFESTVRKGENTLKRELWTKFEAVCTSDGLHFDDSVCQQTTKKGFLDMLEEASSEPTDSDF